SAGGVRLGHVRRELELARPHLDAGQCPDHPSPDALLPVLRRRVHRRVPHGLRPADDPVPGGGGAFRRRTNIFLKDEDGGRPVHGGTSTFQEDPHWSDCLLFYEYFHGDNGAGLGASHQTGWTGLIARTLHLFATTTPEQAIQRGKKAAVIEIQR